MMMVIPDFASTLERMTMGVTENSGQPLPPLLGVPHAAEPGDTWCPVTPVLSWDRAFPGAGQQIGAARRFVASLLDGSPLRDDAVVVVSELFTNALQHTDSGRPGGLVIVGVSRWQAGARVAVTDQGSALRPVIRNPASERQPAERGNGLYLVSRLSGRLDWHDDPSGRTVSAILGIPWP